ncbi:myo-inositol-1(or 4)-monophosphatase [Mariniphaga anaerophila]|uniref:Inositol-1-monophosphatase n=1 Tax=Mariniphaga anaerophila TaxID=1484053 RepID=A0A1M4YL15_9BACT|nr:inositol monophosphatase family protein [Mariniphaga anaerophila]SHF06096.1 myo-inositol-1(or 4)-monophosphatase [Mariniphaga anaerophila]
MSALSTDLNIALQAARAGAEVIREKFGNSSNARVKGEAQGLVTDTDFAAETAIFSVLKNNSAYNILSEESGLLRQEPGKKWVVDPLDGTSNFARGIPLFAVSIGLMEGNDFLLGVIIDPISQKEYTAEKGGGAFCNGKQIVLPPLREDFTPCVFLNHGYGHEDRNNFKKVAEKLAVNFDTLKFGTTAVELCFLAAGSVDGFICSGDSLWDFAAGAVIATEAGCVFSDWQGNPWNNQSDKLLFSRREIHESLVKQLEKIG